MFIYSQVYDNEFYLKEFKISDQYDFSSDIYIYTFFVDYVYYQSHITVFKIQIQEFHDENKQNLPDLHPDSDQNRIKF